MFQNVYESVWATTVLVALGSVLGFALWLRKKKTFLVAWAAIFTIEIVVDAICAGTSQFWPVSASSYTRAIPFVLLLTGDFRYWLVLERWSQRPDAKPRDNTTFSTALVAFLFTSFAGFMNALTLPKDAGAPDADQLMYLSYEVCFIAVALVVRAFILPRRLQRAPAAIRQWLSRVAVFYIVQYALWALSDVIILRHIDAGYLLRLVPNVMYYVAFIPFVVMTAPAEADA